MLLWGIPDALLTIKPGSCSSSRVQPKPLDSTNSDSKDTCQPAMIITPWDLERLPVRPGHVDMTRAEDLHSLNLGTYHCNLV